ncbi:hypothetical protein OCAE111667_08925 [Occultella aeris]|uniref:Uncharacterized protein n=1 Tax=Occultella aeris TaxID=2761496 RepID=A0A7M4DJZ2_9MICO|nr:hypothetical protein [Occultella aeris]VZO37379.1 hypothetical protein HALOF300_02454 [Occultella aeris]
MHAHPTTGATTGIVVRWLRRGLLTLGTAAAGVVIGAGVAVAATEEAPEPDASSGLLASTLGLAQDIASPVTEPLMSEVVAPLTTPILDAVAPVTDPVVDHVVAPVAAPMIEAVAPVVTDVAEPIRPILDPIVEPVRQEVLDPVLDAIEPATGGIVGEVLDLVSPAVDAVIPPHSGGSGPTVPAVPSDPGGRAPGDGAVPGDGLDLPGSVLPAGTVPGIEPGPGAPADTGLPEVAAPMVGPPAPGHRSAAISEPSYVVRAADAPTGVRADEPGSDSSPTPPRPYGTDAGQQNTPVPTTGQPRPADATPTQGTDVRPPIALGAVRPADLTPRVTADPFDIPVSPG